MLPKSLSFIEVIGDPNPKVDVVQKGNLDGEVPEFIDQLREFGDEWGRIGNSEEAH
ncbi:MAG: hypothetical protein R3330_08860 [Saprospiraceae bacterium]|nr:hypothetical protein [Saprospiraceae bacterium]